jgi:hypothetical protein
MWLMMFLIDSADGCKDTKKNDTGKTLGLFIVVGTVFSAFFYNKRATAWFAVARCSVLSVGPLLPVLGLLFGRAAAVCAGDVLLFLGLGLHLALVGVTAFAAAPERDAVLKDFLKIVFHIQVSLKTTETTETTSMNGGSVVLVVPVVEVVFKNQL